MIYAHLTPTLVAGESQIELSFADPKFEASVTTERELKRRWGKDWKLLQKRLAVLRAADTLAVLTTSQVAGKCHALAGDRAGQYAMHLWGSYRLGFEPTGNTWRRKDDGGIDEATVTESRVLEVVDYHGR